jgi:hypothetical protein
MNTYICYYNGKTISVDAPTSLAAQNEAVKQFTVGRKVPKGYEIAVELLIKDGVRVPHYTSQL